MVAGSKQSVRTAESTQELLAGDVLEILDAPPPMRAPAGSTQELLASDVLEVVQQPRRAEHSASSIAPVGIDLPPMRPAATSAEEQEEYNPTRELRAMQRRHLGPVVVATVAVCGVILLVAGINRFSPADATRAANAAQETTVTVVSRPASTPATASKPVSVAPTTATPKAISTSTVAGDAPTTGTIVFDKAGKVWLDGKRLSGTSAMVRCGSHRVKLGPFAKSRAIDVPCGGEITVKK
jgi:hypothetical protein